MLLSKKGIFMKYLLLLPLASLLLTSCMEPQPITYRPVPVVTPKPKPKPVVTPERPKQIHELKEVEDDNFDPAYMYPETGSHQTVKKPEPVTVAATHMSRAECIAMIGQEKFDKYTQMLGSEEGAIKRCTLLKSMQ